MITKEDLKDEDNLVQCECGDYAHHELVSTSPDGNNTCPGCQISWMNQELSMYKKLLRELATPAHTKATIDKKIKERLSELMVITPEDFDELGLEI